MEERWTLKEVKLKMEENPGTGLTIIAEYRETSAITIEAGSTNSTYLYCMEGGNFCKQVIPIV